MKNYILVIKCYIRSEVMFYNDINFFFHLNCLNVDSENDAE